MPARDRARLLLAFHTLVTDHLEDLAWILVYETGKPFAEAKAEVQYALTFSWWYIGETERTQGQVVQSATNNALRYLTVLQPIGPVAILTPWNFPVALLIRKTVSALAAGCTVVVKPSPETPLSTLAIAHLLEQAGFPSGTVNVVLASNGSTPRIGRLLCCDRRIKKVSFTGSTTVGRLLMQQCAPSLKKMTLELGGLGAYLIFPDADIEAATTGRFSTLLSFSAYTEDPHSFDSEQIAACWTDLHFRPTRLCSRIHCRNSCRHAFQRAVQSTARTWCGADHHFGSLADIQRPTKGETARH